MGLTSFRRACPTSDKIALILPRAQSAQQSPVGSHRRGFFWCTGCAGLHGITGITLHGLWRSLCRPAFPTGAGFGLYVVILEVKGRPEPAMYSGLCRVRGGLSLRRSEAAVEDPVGGNISASRDGDAAAAQGDDHHASRDDGDRDGRGQ